MNYKELQESINLSIKSNGNGEITAEVLADILSKMNIGGAIDVSELIDTEVSPELEETLSNTLFVKEGDRVFSRISYPTKEIRDFIRSCGYTYEILYSAWGYCQFEGDMISSAYIILFYEDDEGLKIGMAEY